MKFKMRVTMSDTIEVDTDDYEADTPEDCVVEQKGYFDEGAADPGEVVGLGKDYALTVELVKS